MPVLNGRFYMNPIFGAALERARKANAGREWSEESPESAGQTAPAARPQHRPAHTAKTSGAKHKGHTGDDDRGDREPDLQRNGRAAHHGASRPRERRGPAGRGGRLGM